MLVFLIALKHPKTANSWERASELCNDTIKSLLCQTDQDFKILVCCNEIPINAINSEKVEYLLRANAHIPLSNQEKELDRSKKLKVAYTYAQKFNPEWLMPVDADDFVNINLGAWVKHMQPEKGYFFDCGLIKEGEKILAIDTGFSCYCGTSKVFRPQFFYDFFDNNRNYYIHAKVIGLNSCPIAGAIYNRCNGENWSAISSFEQSARIVHTDLKNFGVN